MTRSLIVFEQRSGGAGCPEMPKTPPYDLELRLETVRLLRSSNRTIPQLAKELGCSLQSLRNWSRQLDVDDGKADGLNIAERDELRRLRRESVRTLIMIERLLNAHSLCTVERHERWHPPRSHPSAA